jgi:DNA-binding transcriptional ArsR family regulator
MEGTEDEQVAARLRGAMAEAMRDPLRNQIYVTVDERPGVTIAQIAERIDQPERRVRHQVERLCESGLIEVDSERKRRNARERHYRSVVRPLIQDGEGRGEEERRRAALSMVRQVVADISRASRTREFGTLEGHAEIRIPGEVDQEGWDALAQLMLRMLAEAEEVMTESAARLAGSGEAGFEAMAVLLLFEGRPWTAAGETPDGPRPSTWSAREGTGPETK